MGLEGFRRDDDDDNSDAERAAELSKNTPPGEADSWPEAEPGKPPWASYIGGAEREFDEGKKLIIKVNNVEVSGVISEDYVDLDDMQ